MIKDEQQQPVKLDKEEGCAEEGCAEEGSDVVVTRPEPEVFSATSYSDFN